VLTKKWLKGTSGKAGPFIYFLRAGRFILATNELNKSQLSSEEILIKYKEDTADELNKRPFLRSLYH
jgi:hypothetical protein